MPPIRFMHINTEEHFAYPLYDELGWYWFYDSNGHESWRYARGPFKTEKDARWNAYEWDE